MIRVLRALGGGVGQVAGAPLVLAAVLLVTLAAAAPFGLVLGVRLQTALATQAPISRNATDIDPEWWMEYRAHAQGLEATFTPAVIGFAAPLDNLSALADGTRRPLILVLPVVVAGLVWALLWGVLIERFHRGRVGFRQLAAAGRRFATRFIGIGVIAAATHVVLYFTVHALLFGPVFAALAARAASERDAFLWRVLLYAIFGVVIAAVSLVADYARVSVAVSGTTTTVGALKDGLRFVAGHAVSVGALYLLTGLLFAGLLATYYFAETIGGARLGGWRGAAVAQAYIVARLAIRMTFVAAEVRLFKTID